MNKQQRPHQPMPAATAKTPADSAGVFFSPLAGEESASAALEPLLASANVWRGKARVSDPTAVCATGYAALDACLPGGGWPVAGLTEVLGEHSGMGELRLLMPALAALSARESGWVVWIAPPYMPNAPALLQWGLAPERMLLIHPRSAADAAWAAEQALTSGTCIAVLLWSDLLEAGVQLSNAAAAKRRRSHAGTISMAQFSRRLQLAAAAHQCWAVCFRPLAFAAHASTARLRLKMSVTAGRRDVHLLKVRGGRPSIIRDFDAGIDVGATMIERSGCKDIDAAP